ncbi:MAG: hypothetical protein E7549_08220 [Ruminococcaceae bacterium]|nr:hypothetical protein [Oscillospiraceae bacterium]
MLSCTFFGHRDAPYDIEMPLRKILIDLITNQNVTMFYVGNQGAFDYIARMVLQSLQKEYTHIRSVVVLAYLPRDNQNEQNEVETLFPDGLELVPPKFAIDRRNKWMIAKADYVVTYVNRLGGASRYKELADKQGKIVYNLADI